MDLDIHKNYGKEHWKDLYITYEDNMWVYYENGHKTGGKPSEAVLTSCELVELDKNNKIKVEEIIMENVNYIGGEYKLVVVTHNLGIDIGDKGYVFKADIDLEISKDDLLVVESNKGYGLVKCLEVKDDNLVNKDLAKKAKAWVVDKVDMTKHLAKKEATERKAYILNKLEEKKEQMETMRMYALLADLDPEAGKLIEELKQLGM